MKKLFIIVAILSIAFIFTSKTNAQISLGAGIGYCPSLESNSGGAYGLGFHVVGKYDLNEKVRIGLNLERYSKKLSDNSSVALMPITGLVEYSLKSCQFNPYIGLNLGIYNYSIKVTAFGNSISDSENYLGLAPKAGILYGISDNLFLNGELKFHLIFNDDITAALGLNGGIIFKL